MLREIKRNGARALAWRASAPAETFTVLYGLFALAEAQKATAIYAVGLEAHIWHVTGLTRVQIDPSSSPQTRG
jgi:hypothetical protein